jgi:lysophospholipid acyltransferase (LPLAT)-like uncharacterized protein
MPGPFKRYLLSQLLPPVATSIVRLAGGTTRYQVTGGEHLARGLADPRPLVGGFLHGRTLLMLYPLSQMARWTVMASKSSDGDFQVAICERIGYETVRGSTGRGGTRAFLEMIRRIRRNPEKPVGFTVDGSRGPRAVVQEGLVRLAQKTGGLLMPATASASRTWVLKTWDRMVIPRPYARVHIVFDELIEVPRKLSEAGVEEYRLKLEESMHRITRIADAHCRLHVPGGAL